MTATSAPTTARDEEAHRLAAVHLQTDPGTRVVYYLPTNAPPKEIRFLEVNDLIVEMRDDATEPLAMGVSRGDDLFHTLEVLDVTPAQWERVQSGVFPLPDGWTLDGAVEIRR